MLRVHNLDVAPAERVHAWRERISAALHPLHVVPHGDPSAFACHLSVEAVGRSRVATGVLAAGRTTVSPAAAADAEGSRLQLYTHLEGVGTLRTRRTGEQSLTPGALLVVLPDVARSSWLPRPAATHAIDLDVEALTLDRSTLHRLAFRALPPPDAHVRTLLRAAAPLARRLSGEDAAEDAGGVVAELADLALRRATGEGPEHAVGARARVAVALTIIEAECGTVGLTCEDVADRLGVSRRRLHQLFDSQHLTVGEELRRSRLRRARRLLAAAEPLTVGEVAARCGFASRSHFAKAFAAEHGMTPSEARLGTGTSLSDGA